MPARHRGVSTTLVTMTRTGWGAADLIAEERIRLLREAFLICGSATAAEEVVQDAFLAMNAHWEGLRNHRAYLYRATVTERGMWAAAPRVRW